MDCLIKWKWRWKEQVVWCVCVSVCLGRVSGVYVGTCYHFHFVLSVQEETSSRECMEKYGEVSAGHINLEAINTWMASEGFMHTDQNMRGIVREDLFCLSPLFLHSTPPLLHPSPKRSRENLLGLGSSGRWERQGGAQQRDHHSAVPSRASG